MALDANTFQAQLAAAIPGALRLANALVDDGNEAEDVAQEALIAAWRARERYDPERAELGAWLRGFVTNFARKAWSRRSVAELSDQVIELIVADPLMGEQRTPVALEALERCLERLAPDDHTTVTGYYGVPGPEVVAGSLGLKPPALRQRVRRIRVRLRTCIEGRLGLTAANSKEEYHAF